MSYTAINNTNQSTNNYFDQNVVESNLNTLNSSTQNYSAKKSIFSSSLFLSSLNDSTISQNLFNSFTNQQSKFANNLLVNDNYYCDLNSDSVFVSQIYCYHSLRSIYKRKIFKSYLKYKLNFFSC